VKKKLMEAFKHDNPKASKAQLAKFRNYITPQHIDKLETQLEKMFHVKLKDTDKDGAPDIVDCQPKNPNAQDTYNLNPRYDSRKSFYGKAKVETDGGTQKLYSYGTLVAEIEGGKATVYGTYSQTTLRHIKDFLQQNGFTATTSKQILKDYSPSSEVKVTAPAKQDAPKVYPFGYKVFPVKEGLDVIAKYEDAHDGFNHVAKLMLDGEEIASAKAHYINRTWESYEFESVIDDLLNKAVKNKTISEAEKKQVLERGGKRAHEEVEQKFGTIANIAKLGEVFAQTKEEKNKWKARMLKAGLPELDIPEDWDTLKEDEKERRLNAVIAHLQKKGG
jgi:hypothetical protein